MVVGFQVKMMTDGVEVRVRLGAGQDKTYHTITHASPEDEGRYFCRATNTMGRVEAFADVTLMGECVYCHVCVMCVCSRVYVRGAGR